MTINTSKYIKDHFYTTLQNIQNIKPKRKKKSKIKLSVPLVNGPK